MKVISLVPSITETLFDFGLNEDEIIGRTKFCKHPQDRVKSISIIGGTKNLNIEKIRSLNPDLIIANKEENQKDQVEELAKDFNVLITDISNLHDQNQFIDQLGKILDKGQIAEEINLRTELLFKTLKPLNTELKVAYLIWQNPYMTVGHDTYIHDILTSLGFKNFFENRTRYPITDISELQQADILMLSSEPYPFNERHIQDLQRQNPVIKAVLVDGEAFSWHGTHPLKCSSYYKRLLSEIIES